MRRVSLGEKLDNLERGSLPNLRRALESGEPGTVMREASNMKRDAMAVVRHVKAKARKVGKAGV
jgi:hypothetical protein